MGIRLATEEDARAISELIVPLVEKFITPDFSAAGRNHLLKALDETSIRMYLSRHFRFHVYEENAEILGVVAMRDNQHLFNLFVGERAHRRGIGRTLWETARDACLAAGGDGVFTVFSSRNAVGVYRRFGFERVGPEMVRDEVICVPMRLAHAR